MTTLKTLFSSSLVISFCLDALFCAGNVSLFLMKTSNLFIKIEISIRGKILACSGYFLGHPRLCLTEAKEAKVPEGNLAMGSIEITSAKVASV